MYLSLVCVVNLVTLFNIIASASSGESNDIPLKPPSIPELEKRLSELGTKTDVVMMAISNLNHENSGLKNQIINLQNDSTILSHKVLALQQENSIAKQNNSMIKSTLQNENKKLKQDMFNVVQENKILRQNMSLLQMEHHAMKQDMLYLNQETTRAICEIKDTQVNFTMLDNSFNGALKDILLLKKNVTELKNDTTIYQTRFQTDLNQLENVLQRNLTSELSKNMSQMQQSIQDVPNMKHQISLLQSSTISASHGYNGRLQSAEGSISTLQHNYNTMQSSYSGLHQSLNSLSSQIQGQATGRCGTYATTSPYRYYATAHRTIVFDTVKTNVGRCYNNGIFTAPVRGVYVFSWTVYSYEDSRFDPEVKRNGQTVGMMYASKPYDNGVSLSLTLDLQSGDRIWIENPIGANMYGNNFASFSGFTLH